MEPAKYFNNVIIGQFALTGIPLKVYVDGRFLTITSTDDIEDSTFGFGMDENGMMVQFDYRNIERLSVSGNEVTLDTYNKGMGAKGDEESEEESEEEEEPKKEESTMKLGNLIKEDAAAIDKEIADLKKQLLDKQKEKLEAETEELEDTEDSMEESHAGNYTFGTGDIIKNINPKCKHFGSMGVVKKVMDVPLQGAVAVYTVTNNGDTYKPGMSLTKTVDQLAPIQQPDDLEEAADKIKPYELGDTWSNDFDYVGMLKAGAQATYEMGIDALQELYASFEDVNYHRENKFLGYAIDEMENPGQDPNQAQENIERDLEDFRKACLATLQDITKGK